MSSKSASPISNITVDDEIHIREGKSRNVLATAKQKSQWILESFGFFPIIGGI